MSHAQLRDAPSHAQSQTAYLVRREAIPLAEFWNRIDPESDREDRGPRRAGAARAE